MKKVTIFANMRISKLLQIPRIPFLDVGATYVELKTEIDSAIQRVLDGGRYIQGGEVLTFESEFAAYVGAKHCVGVGNGLDALKLALRAVGVTDGDEVIVPSHTFIATWLAVTQCGATPVGVDTEIHGYNIDVSLIESAITSKTKAIVMVHLYGQPASIDNILEIASRYGIKVIEDAAQAHGSVYKGRRLGSHSHIVAWSFYPGKNLGAFGDGGAITTNDSIFANHIRSESNYGSLIKYEHNELGTNSRLDPIQAAVLKVKLQYLEIWNYRRKDIANYYISNINKELLPWRSHVDPSESSWHIFPIEIDSRDEMISYLEQNGIESLVHYPKPPHKQGAYLEKFNKQNFPLTEKKSARLISIPIGPHLDIESVAYITDKINGFGE